MTHEHGVTPPSMALVVRADAGDSYTTIAAQFGCDEESLRAANPGLSKVRDGDELVVPMQPSQCVTDPGDTFESVAAQFGTTPDVLRAVNPGVTDLPTGTRLNLP